MSSDFGEHPPPSTDDMCTDVCTDIWRQWRTPQPVEQGVGGGYHDHRAGQRSLEWGDGSAVDEVRRHMRDELGAPPPNRNAPFCCPVQGAWGIAPRGCVDNAQNENGGLRRHPNPKARQRTSNRIAQWPPPNATTPNPKEPSHPSPPSPLPTPWAGVQSCTEPPHQGCIRREGTSQAAPEAVRQAVGGGCQSGWGRLLSVTNAIVHLAFGTCR